MKMIIKLVLLPVIAVLWVLWIIAATMSRVYGVTHGVLWTVLIPPIVLACILQMWQNAAFFAAIGLVSYLFLFGLTVVEVLLEAARKMLLA